MSRYIANRQVTRLGSTPSEAWFLEIPAPTSNGTRDSHWITLRGTAYDGSAHSADWRVYVNPTSNNAGSSSLIIQNRVDGGTWFTKFAVNSSAEVTVGTWKATAIALDKGGTGATTALGALQALLPAWAGNGGKFLRLKADLSDVEWASGPGVTIGAAVTGGSSGRVLYESAAGLIAQSANFVYDAGANALRVQILASKDILNQVLVLTARGPMDFVVDDNAVGAGQGWYWKRNSTLIAQMSDVGNFRVTASVATGATDGFVYIPAVSGTPTGTPTSFGGVPICYDTANNRLYAYNGGWKSIALS